MSFPDRDVDYRVHPELYEVGRGERGVFGVQPYKGELLPLWTIRTPQEAREAAAALTARFEEYREAGEFVGMDMAAPAAMLTTAAGASMTPMERRSLLVAVIPSRPRLPRSTGSPGGLPSPTHTTPG